MGALLFFVLLAVTLFTVYMAANLLDDDGPAFDPRRQAPHN